LSKLSQPMVAECATWLSIVSQLFGTRMGALLEPHGLTVGQFGILHHIVRHPQEQACRVSDIAAAVEVGQPAVTKALAKFQTMGLVEVRASAKDKRAKFVSATPAAGELLGRIYQDIGPDLAQVFGAVDADAVESFLKQLKQLGAWLDANRVGAGVDE